MTVLIYPVALPPAIEFVAFSDNKQHSRMTQAERSNLNAPK